MNISKESFLRENLVAMLKKLKAGEKEKWGIMNAQEWLSMLQMP